MIMYINEILTENLVDLTSEEKNSLDKIVQKISKPNDLDLFKIKRHRADEFYLPKNIDTFSVSEERKYIYYNTNQPDWFNKIDFHMHNINIPLAKIGEVNIIGIEELIRQYNERQHIDKYNALLTVYNCAIKLKVEDKYKGTINSMFVDISSSPFGWGSAATADPSGWGSATAATPRGQEEANDK